jgi:excisionase family DNA binding protein
MVNTMSFFEEDYYRISELTQKFKVSRYTIYKWINEGKIQGVRIGGNIRIVKSSFDSFIQPIKAGELQDDVHEAEE